VGAGLGLEHLRRRGDDLDELYRRWFAREEDGDDGER
jgi:hypothetical protein